MPSPVPQMYSNILVVTPANPAAGTNLVYTLPIGYRYQIVSFRCQVSTDANAANRNLVLRIADPTPTYLWEGMSLTVQAANVTRYYIGSEAGYGTLAVATDRFLFGLPVSMTQRAGWTILTDLNNIQVGDQLSGIAITMHRWEETEP